MNKNKMKYELKHHLNLYNKGTIRVEWTIPTVPEVLGSYKK